MIRVLILLSTLTIIGCIPDLKELEPDVGDLMVESCGNSDHDPSVDVSFRTDLHDKLFVLPANTCLHCHDPAAPYPIGYEYGGFDMSTYKGVMKGGVNSGADMVVPGQPCDSFLYLKLTPYPPVGSRMPWTGPYWEESEMATLTDWISEGANDN